MRFSAHFEKNRSKLPKEARGLAKRILAELDVRDLIRGAGSSRNYLLLAIPILYGTGARVSELVSLNVGDAIDHGNGRVQPMSWVRVARSVRSFYRRRWGAVILAAMPRSSYRKPTL